MGSMMGGGDGGGDASSSNDSSSSDSSTQDADTQALLQQQAQDKQRQQDELQQQQSMFGAMSPDMMRALLANMLKEDQFKKLPTGPQTLNQQIDAGGSNLGSLNEQINGGRF